MAPSKSAKFILSICTRENIRTGTIIEDIPLEETPAAIGKND